MKTVSSADGTLIAYDQYGAGPPIVLVHGMTGSRSTSFVGLRPRLQDDLTVVPMDRRGRGGSGDGPDYAIEREFEDVLAVVNTLGAPVLLFGHSFGAVCALGAATQSDKVDGLILYEPWIAVEDESLYTPAQLEQFDKFLAADDREGLTMMLLSEIVGILPRDMEQLMAAPSWNERLAVAHTIPREARAEETYRLPADQAGKLTIPVLLLLGGDSQPDAKRVNTMLEEALPNARTVVMQGQHPAAMRTAPDMVAGAVLGFWREIA